MKIEINTPQEMFELWKELAKEHKNILLYWDLGAWKTLLTKWFAAGLWIDKNTVQSPTYAYLNSYDNKLLHMDMYRIETENDVREKWINDQISNHEYVAIEWPKFIDTLDIEDYTEIIIEKDWDMRIVEINTLPDLS
jgi:tRNA threonylcarbamoyladenosine biosynthesis protein TsaE